MISVSFVGMYLTTMKTIFQERADAILQSAYFAIGLIMIIMHALCSWETFHEEFPPYLFFIGRWSLPEALIYYSIVYIHSGLRFSEASAVLLPHLVLWYAVAFLGFSTQHYLTTGEITYLPAFMIMVMISNHDIEVQVREGFIMKCKIGEDHRRQDELILSILPEEISNALKANKIENLAEFYDNVTILFCSIVDFGRQSSSTHAQVPNSLLSVNCG